MVVSSPVIRIKITLSEKYPRILKQAQSSKTWFISLASFSIFLWFSFCFPTSPLFSGVVLWAGWQILGPAQEEQPGSQAVPGRQATEGEPDRHPSQLPGEGELGSAAGGGRPEERAWTHQERPGQVRGAARAAVRTHRQARVCKHTHVNSDTLWESTSDPHFCNTRRLDSQLVSDHNKRIFTPNWHSGLLGTLC